MAKKALIGIIAAAAVLGLAYFFVVQNTNPDTPNKTNSNQTGTKPSKTSLDEKTSERLTAQNINIKKPEWTKIQSSIQSKDSSTRFLTAGKLGKIRESQSVEVLLTLLGDVEYSVREQAAVSLNALVGYQVDSAKLKDKQGYKVETAAAKAWWSQNKAKSVNALRLEALKKLK